MSTLAAAVRTVMSVALIGVASIDSSEALDLTVLETFDASKPLPAPGETMPTASYAEMSEPLTEMDMVIIPAAAPKEGRGVFADRELEGGLLVSQADAASVAENDDDGGLPEQRGGDQTGTDPRGFDNKFMPYYRYTELENNLYTNELVVFGMYAFTPKVAMTYEVPVMKHIDYGDVDQFDNLRNIPPGQGGGAPPGGIPFDDLEEDGDNIGIGDTGLRLFYKPEPFRLGSVSWPEEREITLTVMPTIETTLPTATEDTLGSESWILSPAVTFVIDTPTFGFVAAMNFFDFDVVQDDSREDILRYRGRWFLMQPLTKPGPRLIDGLYLLPEVQPIYDFENEEFSFWVGPELGKIFAPGRILYLKPGFGIDPDETERDWTFEVGLRWFF